MQYPEDRRYMTFEQRAQDDPRYRGVRAPKNPKRVCRCGKTVYVDGFGHRTGNTCPRHCESGS